MGNDGHEGSQRAVMRHRVHGALGLCRAHTCAGRTTAGSGAMLRLVLCTVLATGLAGCSRAPETAPPLDVNAAAATLVAMTFEAATLEAQMQPPTPTPPPAPTFSPPKLYIKTQVQCRSGIGSNFKVLATLEPGTMVDLVGRNSAQAAWLVQEPVNLSACWVLAQDSSPSGNFETVPEATPQPGSGQPPSPPTSLSWPFYCTYVDGILYEITTDLSWTQNPADANGFRIYRQAELVADVPANVTNYVDTGRVQLGTDLTYSIEAYNDAGASSRLSHTITSVCK